ncbi:dihydroorotate dehydrogenase 2 [Candidatus Woesearchaeota archaeon]|nr:dihydroorotate dehydrogenase 2 [Candidatus Woesearchaeota archaeon]
MSLDQILYRMLLKLPPETAHDIAKWGMKRRYLAPGPFREQPFKLFDTELDNLLGLAAGFDKNGELVDVVRDYGFGYVEVGSITYHGGKGNSKPRLFRVGRDSLLNRLGLNGDPAEQVIEHLSRAKNHFGINIAKTHNPEILGNAAIDDLVNSYRLVVDKLEPQGKVIYVCLDISCPNTKEGKTFEQPEALRDLLSALQPYRGRRPLVLKLSPALRREEVEALVSVADSQVQGYICGNTVPSEHQNYGRGGLSGQIIKKYALRLIKNVRRYSQKPIIACGGISAAEDALAAKFTGADAGYQVYTAFAYGAEHSGPQFARHFHQELIK